MLKDSCRSGPPRLNFAQCVSPAVFADSIEANVETAESHVQSGTQQLARAADYQVRLNRTEYQMGRKGELVKRQIKSHFITLREVSF